MCTAGHEPMIHSHAFMEEFGVNPLPTYKLMLATAAASIAHMSKCIGAAGRGVKIQRNCLIANCHKGLPVRPWQRYHGHDPAERVLYCIVQGMLRVLMIADTCRVSGSLQSLALSCAVSADCPLTLSMIAPEPSPTSAFEVA